MPSLPRLEYHLINAFTTDSPHSGNQAAVVLFPSSTDPRANDDTFLLRTAQDFGFAETAYLVPIDEKAGRWSLRWFTIFTEVPICGHATLAASKVVLSRYPDLSEIKFETRFWGELTAKKRTGGVEDANSLEVTISLSTLPKATLDKMSETATSNREQLAEPLAKVLGISPEEIIAVGEFKFNGKSLIVEVAPEVDMAKLQVDPKALLPYSPDMTIVTQMQPGASAPGQLRTNSRIYCEDSEDPVTGSAHAFLTGYYLLTSAFSRLPAVVTGESSSATELALDARQLSKRGGKLFCEIKQGEMVDLTGSASDWGQGTLTAWQ